MDRTHRTVLATLLLSWGVFLGVQSGLPTDETEHCHVAWLIGHEHQKPIQDFCQHHQPPLWDVLQLYFRLGADGPEVLYFGRALVLICTGISVLAFFLLSYRLARGNNPESSFPWMTGALSLFPLILFSLAFWSTLVIRPETLSMPLFLFSLVLWLPGCNNSTLEPQLAQTFLAGVLVGAAIYTSPRFVFLAPAVFLLPRDRSRLIEFDIHRALVLGLGAVAFVEVYSVLMSHPLSEIFFNLELNYMLKPVGDGYFGSAAPLLTLLLLFSLLFVFLCKFLNDHGKKRLLCQSVFGLCLLGIVLRADWPYMHPHHFLFLALWLGVMTASAGVDLQPASLPPIHSLITIGAVGGILLCLTNLAADIVRTETIVDWVQLKNVILTRLNKSDRVLCVGSGSHPICALDASYYNNPIGDSPGRLAAGVRLAQARLPLPDCDYFADIRDRCPALIDIGILESVAITERQPMIELLSKYYDQKYITAHPGASLHSILYAVKSPARVARIMSPSVPISRLSSVKP